MTGQRLSLAGSLSAEGYSRPPKTCRLVRSPVWREPIASKIVKIDERSDWSCPHARRGSRKV